MKILKFYADWCSPCKLLTKNIDKFVASHPEVNVEIIPINVDENEDKCSEYKVSNIPVLIKLNDDNAEIARSHGAIPIDKLEKFIFEE